MTKGKTVRDVALPLSDYAVVSENATLFDALRALERAQKSVPSGRQPHRAVLIRADDGSIVGKVDHLGFLRALLPEREAFADDELLKRAGVNEEMQAISAGVFDLFDDALIDSGARLRRLRTTDACSPANARIDEASSLSEAIKTFLRHGELSLLVERHGVTVGILRLSDLFDALAREAMNDEPRSDEEEG